MVEIPLRARREKGIVFGIHETPPQFETLDIGRILSPVLISERNLQFIKEISEYNFCSYSKTLNLLLPDSIWASSGSPPQETWIELLPSASEALLRGKKQGALLHSLREAGGRMREKVLRDQSGHSLATIKTLEQRKLVRRFPLPYSAKAVSAECHFPTFSPEQEKVLKKLRESDRTLLFGPAGSGKTLLALKLAAETIAAGKTVLFLLPEKFVSTAFLEFCSRHLPLESFALYHSFLSAGAKAALWWRVWNGKVPLVFGTRTSLFLPFRNLGLVVMDEEHDTSYKNDQAPRYHTRNAAETLADTFGAKLLLQSATPSLEAFFRAQSEKNGLTELAKRFGPAALPAIEVVDLRAELAARNFSSLSGVLELKIRQTLRRKKQILLLMNRRGRFSALVCRECGSSVLCSHCQSRSTLHQDTRGKEFLLCHKCGHIDRVPPTCPRCHSAMLKGFGSGTQEIEREVRRLFPEARVLRVDRDSTAAKDSAREIFTAMAEGSADIFIGTQIIAKGIDLKNIALVGIVLADTELHLPDFRASEYAFHLFSQMAGRTGRQGTEGEIVLQTYLPEHPAIEFCQKHDYAGFYEYEMAERQALRLPPITKMIRLIIADISEKKAHEKAQKCYRELQSKAESVSPKSSHTLSLAPALNKRQFNKFHYHIFLTGPCPEKILEGINLNGIRVDRDPIESF